MPFPIRLLPPEELEPAPAPRVIQFHIRDKAHLRAHFMPFFLHGGLFIPLGDISPPGTRVSIVLAFLDEPGKKTLTGAVRWIAPPAGPSGSEPGMGIEFDSNAAGAALVSQIERLLAGQGESGARTKTI